uniref:Structural polyprotein n=1 Tax=Hangzhou dicistrovirus 3 TaxID=2979225 RepID=A0A977J6D4_9VIRU|nr:structural polyprotein [Hangzhou dicistrovirus 3]WAM46883.1 structural polyprotein [Hangzhou dicistrovirus 3]
MADPKTATNDDSASGVIATTSDVVQDVTIDRAETRFTDANLVQNELAAISATNISDLDDIATVVKFLQRPVEIDQFTLTSTNFKRITSFGSNTGYAPQPTVASYALPRDIMRFGYKIDKLNNFEWFKADMVLRFMVNVNPFVAGRLWVAFAPMESEVFDECTMLYKSRASVTSYPGVELDLQNNTAAEIRIPWCSQYDAMSLTQPTADDLVVANVHVFALSDLLAPTSSASVPVTVFGHFENIEIKGPTPRRVNAAFQARNPTPETKGPISEIASGIASAGDLLKDVPVIGGVASTVGWAANLVSGVASIFGWSRPVKGSAADPIVNVPGRGFTSFKAEDSAVVLGMANDNQIGEQDINFMETNDEMDIQHIAARPGLVGSINWITDSIKHAVIANEPVGPVVNSFRAANWPIGSTRYRVYDLTLFELLATRFAMWRADVHYKVSLVKTPFHVGRLEIFFVPGRTITDDEARTYDTSNTWRHILDITEQNEVEFIIPYMHKNVMSRTGLSPEADIRTTGVDGLPGSFVVRALTPLSAPATVAQTIQVNIWKWATNVAFACPMTMGLEVPPVPATFQSDSDEEYEIEEEASASNDNVTSVVKKIIVEIAKVVADFQINVQNTPMVAQQVAFGAQNTQENSLNSACTVAGEMITSLRQAIKAHRRYKLEIKDKTLVNTNLIGDFGGYLGFCANIYAFYRGGLSMKIVPNTDDGFRRYVSTQIVRIGDDGTPISLDNPEHITYTDLTPFHEVQTPYYVVSRRGLCNKKDSSTNPRTSTALSPGLYVSTDAASLRMYIGAKDDLTFGFLIGSPVYGLATLNPPS